jgi:hypothetical protein
VITLKVKMKGGHIVDLQVENLIEVDGQKYVPAESRDMLEQRVMMLEGRVAAIQDIFTQQEVGE